MVFFFLAFFATIGIYAAKTAEQRESIAMLSSHLQKFQLEKHMEQLIDGYLRALGENDPQRSAMCCTTIPRSTWTACLPAARPSCGRSPCARTRPGTCWHSCAACLRRAWHAGGRKHRPCAGQPAEPDSDQRGTGAGTCVQVRIQPSPCTVSPSGRCWRWSEDRRISGARRRIRRCRLVTKQGHIPHVLLDGDGREQAQEEGHRVEALLAGSQRGIPQADAKQQHANAQ